MQLDWTTAHAAGVTLVTARLSNETGLDREVRLRNHLDGPVLPPRREGVFEAGWDRDGITLVVEAGDHEAVGYACPVGRGDAADPPVRIESVGTPENASAAGGADGEAARRACRSLGDPRPPRAVVAGPAQPPGATTTRGGAESTDACERPRVDSVLCSQAPTDEAETAADEDDTTTGLPSPVDSWLAGVRDRVETLASLHEASVDEAAETLDERGGLAGVEALDADVERDEARLRAVAETTARLADRAAETEAPIETLRRLT
jgi:hypothetical protein